MREQRYDFIIRGASIYDGSGAPPSTGDVAVRGDRIVEVGETTGAAAREIDARGLAVAPGFIDVHSHDDFAIFITPEMDFKTMQGVTTDVVGNCGLGAAPFGVSRRMFVSMGADAKTPTWEGYPGYFDAIAHNPPSLNVAVLADRFPGGGANLRLTRLVPLQMRCRGIETRLVLPGEAVLAPRTDTALLRALARGCQWFGELAAGTAVSTTQIAAREGVSDSYVRHMVPLALLAPSVVESICAGRQGVCLSAERLKTQAGLPIEWDAQQRLLAD
jgi:amidohydrolase family protein